MKNYKNQNQLLENKIVVLQNKRQKNLEDLKQQLDITYEKLRPSKLLTRALKDIKDEPEVKSNLFESLLSIMGGYLSKRIMIGKSNSLLKKLFGYTIQYVTTKIILNKIKH